MYTGIFKCSNRRWCSFFHPSKHFMRPKCQDRHLRCTTVVRGHFSHFRTCSSGANGRNRRQDKHGPVKDGASFNNEKTWRELASEDAKHCDAHAQLGEQDQKEWLRNEKLAIESKKKESPFLTRQEKFKNEFLRRILPWEELTDTSRSVEQGCLESKVEDDNHAVNKEEWTSSVEAKSNCSDDDAVDLEATAESALKKLVPCSLEEFEK